MRSPHTEHSTGIISFIPITIYEGNIIITTSYHEKAEAQRGYIFIQVHTVRKWQGYIPVCAVKCQGPWALPLYHTKQ